MIYKPLGDKVLVQLISDSEVISDGIYIPESAQEESLEARVIRFGIGKVTADGKPVTYNVKIGDKILLRSHGCGDKISLSEEMEDVYIVKQEDIVAIFTD